MTATTTTGPTKSVQLIGLTQEQQKQQQEQQKEDNSCSHNFGQEDDNIGILITMMTTAVMRLNKKRTRIWSFHHCHPQPQQHSRSSS